MAARDLPPTRRGYSPHEVVSAWQKAVRRSDPEASAYWSFELCRSGYGSWFWKRARVVVVEDIGPAAPPGLIADIMGLSDRWHDAQKRQSDGHEILFVAHAANTLAMAPKSRLNDWTVWHHGSDHAERREIPDEALDKHTLRGKRMGRGREHFIDEASRLEPWTGSLDDLEAKYRELARRRVAKDPTLPHNPWAAGNIPNIRKPPGKGQLSADLQGFPEDRREGSGQLWDEGR